MENKTTYQSIKKVSILLFAMLLTAFASNAQVYVKKGATGLNDGTSWTDAYTDLQAALANAVSSGATEIWVARGEYKPDAGSDRTKSFELLPNVSLLGGFEGIETLASERNHKVFRTVLSGDIGEQFVDTDNSYHVVFAENVGTNAIIDGFVIKKGNASDPINPPNHAGGGLVNLSDNQITNLKIINCTFVENRAINSGGAIYTYILTTTGTTAHTIIQNCIFTNNSCGYGAGGAIIHSGHNVLTTLEVINSTFIGNKGAQGGAVFCNGKLKVFNSTFNSNISTQTEGGAIKSSNSSTVEIKNSILWGDHKDLSGTVTPSEIALSPPSINATIQNNIIQGGYGAPSDNNIDEDPMFEELPTVEGVHPSKSIISHNYTPAYYEDQLQISGLQNVKTSFYAYKDHTYNKTYLAGYNVQVLDHNNLTDGKPTSTLYTDMWFTGLNRLEYAISNTTNRIYFGTPRDLIYWIDRATGESGKIDPLEGITHSLTKIGANAIYIDDANDLLYASVSHTQRYHFYGILELNLVTGEKKWIDTTATSSPVTLPSGTYARYWNNHRIHMDQQENILYFAFDGGLWWWDRDDNSTGLYNTDGGIPVIAGNPQLPDNQVTDIYIDPIENKFYIGTYEGLYVWDRNTNTSKVYNKDNSLMHDNLVNNIDKNNVQNILYVACEYGGLFTLNTQTGEEHLYSKENATASDATPKDYYSHSANYDEIDKKTYWILNKAGTWVWDYNNLVPDYGDLRLKAGSPAIDQGIDADFPTGLTTDLLGNNRFEDFLNIGTGSIDLGAYERAYSEEEEPIVSTPSLDQNYVISNTILKAGVTSTSQIDNLSAVDLQQSIAYFDGLGRPLQNVSVQASPNKQDIIQPIVYDAFGRQPKQYLPYVSATSNGGYQPNAITDITTGSGNQHDFYNNGINPKIAQDPSPFAMKIFEASPLNRILEQGAPGDAWQPIAGSSDGKTIKFHYHTNTLETVRLWNVDDNSNLPSTTAWYQPNELTMLETIDEEGAQVKEFTDKLGRTILKELQNTKDDGQTEWLRTYYVYDDFNNLRFVFPPKAVKTIGHGNDYAPTVSTEQTLENLVFQYRYDHRNRMIMKKVPGAALVLMVYDQRDRLVLTQDGNQRELFTTKWHFTKYDAFNRPIMTGVTSAGTSNSDPMVVQSAASNEINAFYNTHPYYETYNGSWPNGYTNEAFPLLVSDVNTLTFYDNYDFRDEVIAGASTSTNYIFTNELGLKAQDALTSIKGQVTGSRTRVLGEVNQPFLTYHWLNSVSYYDDRYRVIQSVTDNYNGGFDRVTSEYDFVGKVLRTKQTHSKDGVAENVYTINQSFTYDHAGRLLNTFHKLDDHTLSADSVLLASNEYNALGELVEKNLHAKNMDTPEYLQSVDYRYNIRGWLTNINNSALNGTGINMGDEKIDLFGMELLYNNEIQGVPYNGYYNPNELPSNFFMNQMNGINGVPPIIGGFDAKPDVFNTKKPNTLQNSNKLLLKQTFLQNIKNKKTSKNDFGAIEVNKSNDELLQFITQDLFLNVDTRTLSASTEAVMWITEDFTSTKGTSKNLPDGLTTGASLPDGKASVSLVPPTNPTPTPPPGTLGIIEDQLLLYLDARNTASYPGTGNTWFDLSPQGNDANINWSGSFYNNNMNFWYGGGQITTANNIPVAQNESFSVGWWATPTNDHTNILRSTNDYGAFKFSVKDNTNGAVDCGHGNTTATRIKYTELTGGTYPINQEHYVVYTYSNDVAKFYKNGILLYEKNIGPMTKDWAKLSLTYFKGVFNSVQVYGKALSALEVAHNYRMGYGFTVAATLPATPSAASGNALSFSQTQLSWTDNATDEVYYAVERSTDPNNNFAPVAYIDANSNSYQDHGLDPGTAYYYKIKAVNTLGASASPTTFSVTTTALPTIYIVKDSLQLYLDAGNASSYSGSGTAWADISGSGNDATLDAGVTYANGHLAFSNNGFTASVPAINTGDTNFTVGFWMKPSASGYLYNNLHASSSTYGYGAFYARNLYTSRFQTGVYNKKFDYYSIYQVGQWEYLVFTYENGMGHLYKNGLDVTPAGKTMDAITADFVGLTLTKGYGSFDVLEVYNKTLSAAEVSHNYDVHKNRYFNPTTAPLAPSSLSVNSFTADQIKITWQDHADNEDVFEIEYALSENGTFTPLANAGVNINNYAHSNLPANTTYWYRVRAVNSIGNSEYTNVVEVKTLSASTVPPSAPSSLSASAASDDRINLTWIDNTSQEDNYVVERSLNDTLYQVVATLPAGTTMYGDTGLDPTTQYFYKVKAMNSMGASGYSNMAQATTTSTAPVSIVTDGLKLYLDATLTASYDGMADSWFDISGNGNDAILDGGVSKVNDRLHFDNTGFTASLPGFLAGTSNYSVGFWIRPNTTGYGYNGVFASGPDSYGIGAFSAYDEGNHRFLLRATTNKFDSYSTYQDNTWVYITYTYSNNTGKFYKNGSLMGTKDNGAVTDAFMGMELSKGHGDFEVLQVYDKTLSSTEVTQNYNAVKDRYMSTSAVPATPTTLAAATTSKSQVNLSWTDNANNEGNYVVEFSTDDGTTYTKLVSLSSESATFEHAGLLPGQTVYYRVMATNSTGNSAYSNVVNATTLLEEPTGLAAIATSATLQLTWTDNSSNEVSFLLERKEAADANYGTAFTIDANQTNFTDIGLTPETAYTYRITAIGAGNNSAASNELAISTMLTPPNGVMAFSQSAYTIQVNWIDNTNAETSYKLERSITSTCGFEEVATLPANTVTVVDGNLTPETTYFYRVKACDANGCSDVSIDVAGAETLPLLFSNPDLEFRAKAAYNGNISAVKWKTSGADEQAYAYTYDKINRIKSAGHAHKAVAGSWNTTDARFNVGNITYDVNGNIESLKRQSKNLAGTYVMDDLEYAYEDNGNSNRLLRVGDASGSDEGFKDGNTGLTDYTYDANGNLISDANKDITSIEYNYLNLPKKITFGNGDMIVYIYDAAGNKLAQKVTKAGVEIKNRIYIAGFHYEQDTLRFVQHGEGRAVKKEAEFEYQYNLTDHLGNIRVTVADNAGEADTYTATIEDANNTVEANDFGDSYTNATKITSAIYNHTETTGSEKSIRLSGAQGEVIGLAKSLRVYPGDTISMEVFAKYVQPDPNANTSDVAGFIASGFLNAFSITSGIDGGSQETFDFFGDLFAMGPVVTNNNSDGAPNAYLNYMLYDDDFMLIDAGFQSVSAAALENGTGTTHEQLSMETIVNKEGYMYIYLSNEHDQLVDVFFDDLTIVHKKSPIVQTEDYYPFGLTFNQQTREGTQDQRYGFQGQEDQKDLDLGWVQFKWRMHNPSIGRFFNVDPLAHVMPSWSPYTFVFNNPLIFVDPDGRYPIYVITRSYAPFKTFGPGNNWYGDDRGHTLDRGASYRSLASINYDTETRQSSASGGLTRSHTVDGSKDATSRTFVDNRSKGSNIDVHSAGKNAAQPGAWDIDQFTKLSITTDGNIKKNHILNISGTISGDDFPNQESFIYL